MAAAEKGASKIRPKRKSSVSPYRCMFECALSAQMEQLHEVLPCTGGAERTALTLWVEYAADEDESVEALAARSR